ncbi:hypothetical protein BD410DRAFT_182148 [Rickenella mellea]|uniref:Uncharacterized protein n=1 Tax=Rickenella mellea TaxID=50990 RepID=A0A4Y7Q6D6_9AGAM|nr:hypothetical protein BD410DRAFT_182148 [Rickenella mellea]
MKSYRAGDPSTTYFFPHHKCAASDPPCTPTFPAPPPPSPPLFATVICSYIVIVTFRGFTPQHTRSPPPPPPNLTPSKRLSVPTRRIQSQARAKMSLCLRLTSYAIDLEFLSHIPKPRLTQILAHIL